MDKKRLLQEIIDLLRRDAKKMVEAAKTTHDAATHADNKAENKYDTRGLEASYLAEGQARQAEEAEANVLRFEQLSPAPYEPGDEIEVGALVTVEMAGYQDHYFCGPGAGGLEIDFEGEECTIVTRDSPMGQRLYGAKKGAAFEMNGRPAKIVDVV